MQPRQFYLLCILGKRVFALIVICVLAQLNLTAQLEFFDATDFDFDYSNALDEYTNGTNPFNPDTDGDGLLDGYEGNGDNVCLISTSVGPIEVCNLSIEWNTDPLLWDTDGDGLSDGQELDIDGVGPYYLGEFGTNALIPDTDQDGLLDGFEVNNLGSDPTSSDSDGDFLADWDEVMNYGTSPILVDTDGDNLTDYAEIFVHMTDPLLSDTDGDGLSDSYEVNVSLIQLPLAMMDRVQLRLRPII
jgi:hypothetical protein